jgi:hypothetical protein
MLLRASDQLFLADFIAKIVPKESKAKPNEVQDLW